MRPPVLRSLLVAGIVAVAMNLATAWASASGNGRWDGMMSRLLDQGIVVGRNESCPLSVPVVDPIPLGIGFDPLPLGIGFDADFGFNVPNIAPYLRGPIIPGIPGIPGIRVPGVPDVRLGPVPDVRIPDVRVPDVRVPDVRVPEVRVPEIHPRR